jgi:ABC-type thiamin/hydroxymethylpyrimidine transport system permease subunit
MFIGLSILSLLFGYVSLYYVKTEVVHGTSFHPVDIMTFKEFITINLGFPDILSAIIGGLAAYGLSDKIAASIKGIFSSRSRYG